MSAFRRRRPKLDVFRPGLVFYVAKGTTWLNPDKPRPFVLATSSSASQLGTFVYGSTRPTELHHHAAVVPVMPRLSGVNANGLLAPTYFFPGVMLPIPYPRLPAHVGGLGVKTGALRGALSHAIGLGGGTCENPFAVRGSMRGRIVILHPDIEAEMDTRFAVVITEHLYSVEGRYQLVVPIVRAHGQQTAPSVLRVRGERWIEALGAGAVEALLVPTLIQSVWQPAEIVGRTRHCVDGETLARLEDRLREIFQLDPTPFES